MANVLATQVDESQKLNKTDRQSTSIGIRITTLEEAFQIAKAFALSGMFPDAQNAGQALAKIMVGAEYGFSPAASMNAFHFIHGKLQMAGIAIGTLIKRHPHYDYRVVESTNEKCSIDFLEDKELIGNETFTVKDATRQGTQNMTKFPKAMLWNRAMSNGAKMYMPDIFGGQPVYAEGELDGEAAPSSPATGSIKDRIRARQEAITVEAEPEREITADGEVIGETVEDADDYVWLTTQLIGSTGAGLNESEVKDLRAWCESNGKAFSEVVKDSRAKGFRSVAELMEEKPEGSLL